MADHEAVIDARFDAGFNVCKRQKQPLFAACTPALIAEERAQRASKDVPVRVIRPKPSFEMRPVGAPQRLCLLSSVIWRIECDPVLAGASRPAQVRRRKCGQGP